MQEFVSRIEGRPRVQLSFEGDGRTRQSSRDECDINMIMSKYAKTGFVDHLARHGAEYGFADSVSFHEAMNIVTRADQMFADLPSVARNKFHGDPAEFLDFVGDSENHEEMVKLGLAIAKVPAPTAPVGGGGEPEPIIAAKPPVAAEAAETPE